MLNALQTSTEGEGGKHQKNKQKHFNNLFDYEQWKKYKESLKGGGDA